MRLVALALVALTLTGCESTQDKAAKLERAAKRHEELATNGAQHGLSITRLSTKVEVVSSSVLNSSEGAAAVVTLRNLSPTPLRNVPIEIAVKSSSGAVSYTNDAAGLSAGLASVPLVPAHGETTWIDDQVQASGGAASVEAKLGEGEAVKMALPQLTVQGAHLFEDPTNGLGAEGTLLNHSRVTQKELVLYAVARRGGTITAAGRAVLPEAPAGASTPFQIFFIGNPHGGKLEVIAPPSTIA